MNIQSVGTPQVPAAPSKVAAQPQTASDAAAGDGLEKTESWSHDSAMSGKSLRSLAVKTAVGAAVGAGVLALSGGSVLAAVGISTAFSAALGVVKAVAGCFMSSLNFDGGGISTPLSKDFGFNTVLLGGLGAVKGAAEGVVFGSLVGLGFGPLAGALAGAVLPSAEKAGWHLFENHQHNKAMRGGLRD